MSSQERTERRAGQVVLATFLLAGAAAGALVFIYWWDDNIQLEGAFTGICFLALAIGLIVWSHHLLPEGPFAEEYPDLQSPAHMEATVLASLDRGGIGRRRLLLGSLGLAGAGLTAGLVSSLRALGPTPGSLAHTPWRDKRVLVTSDGKPVHADDLPVGGVLTVFPQGFTTEPNVPAALIHLPPGANHPLPGRGSWAPRGLIAYSKVCSHAGCPVNLYNRADHSLMCPCHQSTFDVTRGARPVFGPAGGPLSQLPLAIGADGVLHSTGDYSAPPGPVYWHHGTEG